MSSLYKVTEIEGKGLGCVAISDIKKGSLILMENPQLCFVTEERKGSSMWIKSLLKSFYEMSKAHQHEYMTLHNKFNNLQFLQSMSEDIQYSEGMEVLKLEVGKFEQDPEKAEEILKIVGIYFANTFGSYVCFKVSRFNHSCQPNATLIEMNDQKQLRAIGKIKAGKEIKLNYLDEFAGFRNQKYRQQNLKLWGFLCKCELCENDVDVDAEAFEAFIQEAEKLTIRRESIPLEMDSISLAARYYSLENCKKEIMCYKQLYNVGKDQNIQPYFLFMMLEKGFTAAATGYQLYKATDFEIDAINFEKAAEKFGNILGNDVVKGHLQQLG